MIHRHHDAPACREGLCHLSDEAQERYRNLMRGGCPEHAERLRRDGVWA